ncbi:type II secretion system F family protein [Anaerosolibacter sp.]|uniref:type II secretion system F family protein n=1 Tax=Anaerosolibacter sp. TaxID=1872527 RepID=UPI0039EEE97C
MPTYQYKAMSRTGENIVGTYTAASKAEVLQMMREKQFYPIHVDEIIEGKDVQSFRLFNRIKTKDIAVFCRQFYAMLNAGVTILSCLDILRQQIDNKRLRFVVGEVYEEVQKGLTFSEALKKHDAVFPELLIHMVEAGEVSGTLDVIMDRMATHYEKENKIQNKVKGAMVYPIVLSFVSVAVVIFLLTFVMPTFVGMFEGSGVELPLPTRILLSSSTALQKYWYIFFLLLSLVFYLLKKYLETDMGKSQFDLLKFRIPVIKGTTQKVVTSRFTRTLSTLLSSGIPLLQALEIVAKVVGNKVVADGILKAKEDVRKGIELAGPIKNMGLFPPMVDSMIRIGEESGSLDEILDRTANFYDDEVETALQRMTTLLEPLMIVIMAVAIGAIVIAMVLPMFDMINTVNM